MSDMNCPFCGEPEETDTPSGITIYRCGTLIYPNGSSEKPLICDLGRDLRREREAHNQTKRERDESRKSLDEMSKYLAQATAHRDHAETEMRKWMAFAKNVLGERDKVMQNAKLLDIAQWFANHFVDECCHLPHEDQELHDRLSLCPVILKARELKAELDQLKEDLRGARNE
jgi:hypothetical protein